MKTFTKLTFAPILVAVCAAASLAQAADIVAPPRTLDQIRSLAKVGSSGGDQIDRTVHSVPPRTLELQQSLAKSGGAAGDKIIRTGLLGTPRERETYPKLIELAPLK